MYAVRQFRDELIRELSCNNIQSEDSTQFPYISKIVLEKKHLMCVRYNNQTIKRRLADIAY